MFFFECPAACFCFNEMIAFHSTFIDIDEVEKHRARGSSVDCKVNNQQ